MLTFQTSRGRKIYKRFPSDSSPPSNQISNDHSSFEDHGIPSPRFTRSSIKPRLLFPTAQQQRERQLADEETTTDIEPANDCEMSDTTIDEPETQTQEANPVQTTLTDAPPLSSAHATRSATKKLDTSTSSLQVNNGESLQLKKSKKSPFDGWARRKAGASSSYAAPKGTKRHGETMQKGDESDGGVAVGNSSGSKRVKSGTDRT